jgi:predicted nucleotide-binding protein (sugar kinase/HSP70/actin superfamily)
MKTITRVDAEGDVKRILVFENEGGLNQKVKGNGVQVNPEFFLATVNALNLADVINEWVYTTRPFEVIPGKTEEARKKALDFLYEKLKNKPRIELKGFEKKLFSLLKMETSALFLKRFIHQITSNYYTDSLKEVRKMFEEVEVDRFKQKTTVKITGEFWAMTTESAGNFNMFEFLEKENAALLVEPVASLIQFLFSKGMLRHRNRKKVLISEDAERWWFFRKRLLNIVAYYKKLWVLKLGHFLFRRE